jgi:hypothetical protein
MSAEIEGEVREVDEERAIVVRQPDRLAQAPTPEDTLSLATRMATALKDVVEKQKLFAVIQGKKYPQVEAWMTIARMDNVVAREARPPIRRDDGSYEAFVELIRLSDGMVVGAGSALCGTADDRPWATRGEPARRSMAVTRATSRAFRQQYCPAPDQLVLTADLRWVRADSLKAGDGIVGFDKELGPKMQYRRSVVVAAEPGRGDLYEIVTDLGSTVVSDGHPFVRLPSKRRAVWTNAVNLDVGDRLAFMVAPFGPDRTYEAGWMAGFLDGEGSVHPRLGVYVGQKAGAIADRLVADAHQLGFELRTHVRARSMVNFTVYGGMATWLTLLGRIRPLRLLAYSARLWEGRNAMRRRQVATVQSVRPLGRGAIVAIETSTETLIVDGFLSHNSWIMALAGYEPTPAEEMPRDDGPIAASTPEPERTHDGGLIGTAELGKGDADFELRQTPDGFATAFRLVSGRKSIKVIVPPPLAEPLVLVKGDVLGKTVKVWGHISDESFRPRGAVKDVTYQVLTLVRIEGPDFGIPSPVPAPDAELDAIAEGLPA